MKVKLRLALVPSLIATILIAACSGQAANPVVTPLQTVEIPQAVETAAPTMPPAITEQPVPTEFPATLPPTQALTQSVSADAVSYQIVPGESQVTYQVGETLINQNNAFNIAQGITPQISGEITVDFHNPQASTINPIEVDISQFKSDSSRRDNTLRERFLESAKFPIATFKPTSIEGLPASYQEGDTVSFQVGGDLTIREVTRPATFDVTAVARRDSLEGNATTTLLMSDFGFGPISIGGILNTEDEVNLDFKFVARPGG